MCHAVAAAAPAVHGNGIQPYKGAAWEEGRLLLLSSGGVINYLALWLDGKSFMYSTNKIGPGTLTCGMPLVTGFQVELAPFMHTCCTRSDKKAFIQCSVSVLNPIEFILLISLLCGTLSNAFVKSRYTVSIESPLSIAVVHTSITFSNCSTVERPLTNPYC